MKGYSILSFIYKCLPIGVVIVCVGFFIYAFNITAESGGDSCDMSYATYYVKGTNNCDTSYVCIPAEQWARLGRIAEKEHARFRAELGTWLSVFGLLSIIATVIVPVASYRLNLEEFNDKLKALEDFERQLEKKVDRQTEKSKDVGNTLDVQESITKESIGIEAIKEKGSEDAAIRSIEECRLERSQLFTGNYSDSVLAERFVGLLQKVNDDVLQNGEGEVIKLALDFINTINIYLGKRDVKGSRFEEAFNERMRAMHPLSLTVDQIAAKYEGGNLSIYQGFYKAMFNRQSNERAI